MNPQGFSPSSLLSEDSFLPDERQTALMTMGHMNHYSGYSHSFAATTAANFDYQEEPFESIEEIEAQTIGNLLPDDDDLLSGVIDGFDSITHLNNGEEMEELDLFSSVGGLELGEDGFVQRNTELFEVNSNDKLSVSTVATGGENPLGDCPSRMLFVRNINSNIEDSVLTAIFEQYGEIQSIYTTCKHQGFVMVSYYDARAACKAMKALQNKLLQHRKLDIHFSIPKENFSGKYFNLDTLAIFNLDSFGSNEEILEVFGAFGEIKGIHEDPHRSSHRRFVEFYDVRSAESAFRALNSIEIAGKQIKLELCSSRRFMQLPSMEVEKEEPVFSLQQQSPSNNSTVGFSESLPFGGTAAVTDNGKILGLHSENRGSFGGPFINHVLHNGISSIVSNSLPSLLRVEPGNRTGIVDSGQASSHHLKFEIQGVPDLDTHSLPEYRNALSDGLHFVSPGYIAENFGSRPSELVDSQQFRRVVNSGKPLELNEVFCSSASGSRPPGHRYMWNSSHQSQPQAAAALWSSTPSFVNGIGAVPAKQMHGVPRTLPHMFNSVLSLGNHHVVSSPPSIDPTIWDRCHTYAGGESADATTVFHPASLGNMRISGSLPHPLEFVPRHMFPGAVNCMEMPIPSKNIGVHPHHQRCMIFPARGQTVPTSDSPNESSRNRRNESNLSQSDNRKQFGLDIERIIRGEDKRTTLMIKNIPNKYTSKMLLAAIDERHKGSYDFIYLPIDFKAHCSLIFAGVPLLLQNKCNVGYAFINMTDPSLIVPLYQTFNGKKWEKFNSEKVASLAYARIQGKTALIAHFQNSSLMNEDKRCRPILFHTDGPNSGDQ
ncbi:hypothetical protein M569_09854, partial [Genlisea aurea]